jgi:hypothetical protein
MSDIDLSQDACDFRLFETLLHLTEHPERWHQDSWGYVMNPLDKPEWVATVEHGEWPCGTYACLAGTAAIEQHLVTLDEDDYLVLNVIGQRLLHERPHLRTEMTHPEDDFEGITRLLFGFNAEWTRRLVSAGNTLERLWTIAHVATAGRVTLPEQLVDQVRLIDERKSAGVLAEEASA